MICYSNSKINIGLSVLNRREDGFHNIETIFFPVKGLCDAIEIVKRDDDDVVFSSSGNHVDCPAEKNSCVKAYRLMKSRYGIPGANIHLHKKVPFEAGLGGGSADAACVIKAINSIYYLGLPPLEMEKIASELGSDTPFFIRNIPMFGQGRGEILSEIQISLKGLYLTIIKPNFGVSTAEAYSLLKLKRHDYSVDQAVKEPVEMWKDLLINDFEEAIFNKYPILDNIKKELYKKGAIYASMSGSGSSIFSLSDRDLHIDNSDEYMFIYSEKI